MNKDQNHNKNNHSNSQLGKKINNIKNKAKIIILTLII